MKIDHRRRLAPEPSWGMRLFVLLGFLLTGQGLEGQRLRGRLLDLETNQPVVGGIVTLLTVDSVLVGTAITDEAGSWRFTTASPGRYLVEARRLGYRPWTAGPINLKDGDDLSWLYHLEPAAIELDPVEVSAVAATNRYLETTGFFTRQRADFGHYITPEAIERRQAASISELLRTIPGVRVVSTGNIGEKHIQLRGSFLSHGGICRPRIYVDGLIFLMGDGKPKGVDDFGNSVLLDNFIEDRSADNIIGGMNIDDIAHPSTIAAIEVYRSGAQVPVKFGGTSIEAKCGVIVVWTRVGRMRTGTGEEAQD